MRGAGLYEAANVLGPYTPLVGSPSNRLTSFSSTARGEVLAVGDAGTVLFSEDHGATFWLLASRTHADLTCSAIDARGRLLVCGSDGSLLVSSDRSQFQRVGAAEAPLIAAAADGVGFVALDGAGTLWVETEGAFASRPTGKKGLCSMAVGADGVVFIGGLNGLLLSSRDRGQTFSPAGSPGKARLSHLHATSDGTLWTAGTKGMCTRSSDGVRWRSWCNVPTKQELVSVWADEKRVFVVDKRGDVFISTDRGTRWKASSSFGEGARAVAFTAPDTAVVLSHSGLSVAHPQRKLLEEKVPCELSVQGSLASDADGRLWLGAGTIASTEDGLRWMLDTPNVPGLCSVQGVVVREGREVLAHDGGMVVLRQRDGSYAVRFTARDERVLGSVMFGPGDVIYVTERWARPEDRRGFLVAIDGPAIRETFLGDVETLPGTCTPQGTIWLGPRQSHLLRSQDGGTTFDSIPLPPPMGADEPRQMASLAASAEGVFVGTWQGRVLWSRDGAAFTPIPTGSSRGVSNLCVQRTGELVALGNDIIAAIQPADHGGAFTSRPSFAPTVRWPLAVGRIGGRWVMLGIVS